MKNDDIVRFFHMAKILVTGGAGYIGSHTAHLLLGRGHDVQILDDLSRGHRHNVPPDRLHVLSLSDTSRVAALLADKVDHPGEDVEGPDEARDPFHGATIYAEPVALA